MLIAVGVLVILAGACMVWLHIPYSPVKRRFQKDIAALSAEDQLPVCGEVFSKNDFSHFPMAIQKYIKNCGYIGTPQMSYLKMEYHDVTFMQGKDTPALTIDYTQCNFIKEPCRIALIDSRMFGIPFEGYDDYQHGRGNMKGVLAKDITLFHQTGADMDRACLVTFLAESLFAPTILLQDYNFFEEIDDFQVRATIHCGKETASGIFTFNEQYEMISFLTNDRAVANADGTMTYVPWSALWGEYQFSKTGVKYPKKFQAVWNYPDGDFIYFDGIVSRVSYGYQE